MKKETLLSYIGKGIVNHKGYKINVTNDYLERTKLHYLQIELKPINDYTDSVFFRGFLEHTNDDSFENIEIAFEEAYEKMRKQEEIHNKKPLKLIQVEQLSNSAIASFRSENKIDYILMDSRIEGKVELCKFYIEPEYEINIPVEINGQVLKPDFSFWLCSGIYDKEEFMKVLEKEKIEDMEEEEEQ